MATITLSLSQRANEIKRSEIVIRFSISRTQRFRVNSGLFVDVNRWSKKNEISIPKLETDERQELLQLANKIESLKKHIFLHFEESDKLQVSKEWLIECIDRFHFSEKYVLEKESIFDTFNEFIDKKKFSPIRVTQLKVVYRSLKRYELYKKLTEDKKYKLTLNNVTSDTLIDFEKFLMNEYVIFKKYPQIYKEVAECRNPKPRGQNTINDLFGKIRTFFIWSVANGKTDNNPFHKYSIENSIYGTPYYITIDERNQLYKTDVSENKQLETQRDIFVFHCLIGCRIGDLWKMTNDNIINGAVEYIARKTIEGRPVTVRVPLNAMAKEIIDKYKDENRKSIFPFISEQKYNIYIKEAFLIAGLTRMVTVINQTTRKEEKRPLNEIASSHLARRCFVGNLYKQVKDPNLVGALSGHKEGSKAFARYREIDDEMKIDLVNLLL